MPNDSIQVERDGVVLGWRLVVVLAAAILGIYIATVVGPLDSKLEVALSRIDKLEEQQEKVQAHLEIIKAHIVRDEQIQTGADKLFKEILEEQRRVRAAIQDHAIHHATTGHQ